MNRWLYTITFLLFFGFNIKGQTYHFDKKVDLPLLGTGILSSAYFAIKEPTITKPNTEQLIAWSREEVSAWERAATYNWSERAITWSDVTQGISIASPLLLLGSQSARTEYKQLGLMFFETMLINQGIVGSLKVSVQRRRPFVFNEEAPYQLKYRRQVYYSFVSGHTSASAAATFFAAKVYTDLHPDSRWKPWIWAGAITLPAMTGFLRYEGGKHFITDVAAGYAIGAFIGYFVPALHKKDNILGGKITALSMAGGAGIRYRLTF